MFLTDVQKLCGPEISQFLPCMLQFLDSLWRLLHREIDHFTLDLLNSPILNAGPSEKFLFVDYPKEDLKEREFNPYNLGGIPDLPKKPSKTREASI